MKEVKENPTISVKFNKEVRTLTLEEATELAQKGLKYDLIAPLWNKLKDFAKQDSMSTADFLFALEKERTRIKIEELTQQCGGNGDMAKRIMELEGQSGDIIRGKDEFKEYFPDKNPDDLPNEVTDRAKENNSNLLDEYLRFNARQEALKAAQLKQNRENLLSSVGSQKDGGILPSPEKSEFLRGIWNN